MNTTVAQPSIGSLGATLAQSSVVIERVDLSREAHGQAMVYLLDQYARDDAGMGRGLPESVKSALPSVLAQRANYLGWIAWAGEEPAGLLNAFEGISTFRAEPNLNIHDIAVVARFRRRGIARALLDAAEQEALRRGCCKLTLEVLQGNIPAFNAYLAVGFKPYGLDPKLGSAQFLEKKFYGD